MEGLLSGEGHTAVATPDDADVIIVNTCSFIAAARDETLGVLQGLGAQKRADQRLIAAGCMAQSHGDLVGTVSGVDSVIGTQQWARIGELVATLEPAPAGAKESKRTLIPLTLSSTPAPAPQPLLNPTVAPSGSAQPPSYADWRTTQIRRTRNTPSAYLKISDGCNLRCAFCTIPSFKGDMASKAVGAILAEAQELAARGVREIVLVAQHLTDYGRDLGLKGDGLAILLDELSQVLPEQTWVRLMYAYPHGISEKLIRVMAERPQILPYLDMPLQHAHPATLRRMRRPPDADRTRTMIAALREAMPDITLRSTFIVGFPGETAEEFRALLSFLEETQLDRVGAFRYSQEPGTHAATLPNPVRPQVIEKRWHELMQLQQGISRTRNQRWAGRTIDVLIEGNGAGADGRPLAIGRSFRDAPEVDGQVFVWGQPDVGSVVTVRVTQATDYDLWGEVQVS
jgi:ribosomal protein S12 methylthiotransferase